MHALRHPIRSLVVLLALMAGLLAVPGSASAVFTGTVAGSAITLTGDDAADTLVIGEAGGFLTHNLTDPGFDNSNDFDSATAGTQNAAADNTATFTITTAGGDDNVTFNRIQGVLSAVIDGGAGDDVLSGTDGADTMNGGAGVDRVIGGQGGDTMLGDADDDTLVWNNGDGTDNMDGGLGQDRIEVNGSFANPDVFTLVPVSGGARFDRTNVGLFGLNISASELISVSGFGGDDTLTVSDNVPLGVTFDGGQGNDTFTGGNGDDAFFGGSGNDTGTGNGGRDLLDGQSGNDTLRARDNIGDLVRCGDGADSTQVDSSIVDIVIGCEIVDASPLPVVPPPPPPPILDITALPAAIRTSSATLARNRRSFVVTLACPAAETGGCRVALAVTTNASIRIGSLRARLLLATVRANLNAGQTRRITVRVPAGIGRLFGTRRTLTLRLTAQTTDASGNVEEVSRRLTLRLPPRR